MNFARIEDQKAVVGRRSRNARPLGIGGARAPYGDVCAIAVIADVETVHAARRGEVLRQHLRPGRIADVDWIDVTGTQIRRIVSEAVRREIALVTADCGLEFVRRPAIVAGADRYAAEQLRKAAIAGDVIELDFRAAVAVERIDSTEHLASLVHLERFPWIEHRGGFEIRRGRWIGGVRGIDRHDTQMRPIRRERSGIVVVALVPGLVGEERVLPASAIPFALTDQLQIAAIAFEPGCARRRGDLALKIGLGFIARAARCLLHHERRGIFFGAVATAVAAEERDCRYRDETGCDQRSTPTPIGFGSHGIPP